MSDAFANYDLYADPYMNRLRNEVAKVRLSKEGGVFTPSGFQVISTACTTAVITTSRTSSSPST